MASAGEIKGILKRGEATIGAWLQLPSPDAAEIVARAGYDWAAVDLEHGSFGPGDLPNIFRAIECGGAAPFARLPDVGKVWIKNALEAGAQGLVFPMIESGEQLSEAIDLSTYPGMDEWRKAAENANAYRGVGFCRANEFGRNFDNYRERTRDIVIVAQIEHVRAVSALDAILAHPRLNAIMVGPYDLSGSMGLTGRFDHPDFRRIMDEIARKCREHCVPMGTHVVMPDPEKVLEAKNQGYQFIAYGIDTVFLWKAADVHGVKQALR